MTNKYQEWLKQADYDLDTAEYMFNGGRYLYAVFMCHLSIEKALKGLYVKKKEQIPPKVHNLIYFLNQLEIKPEEVLTRFVVRLSEASVVTRYPEDIARISKDYTKPIVQEILKNTSEVLKWIKAQF